MGSEARRARRERYRATLIHFENSIKDYVEDAKMLQAVSHVRFGAWLLQVGKLVGKTFCETQLR